MSKLEMYHEMTERKDSLKSFELNLYNQIKKSIENFEVNGILNLEVISGDVYLENFSDFSKCEGEWLDLEIPKEKFLSFIAVAKKVLTEMDDTEDIDTLEWDYIEERLLNGKVIHVIGTFYRAKNELPKCPLCGSSYEEHERSLSRRDNTTSLCNDCGRVEGLNDFVGVRE